ncbi:hypothetical protein [Natrialbaceae archaeon AArc-T1-2]|uniref:hypothetical protein n=1 Tax=Natrialbaceae archaeon AArc-T1-2 TaxID=3053904 RepID=UPI00255A8FBA|nr:hypothetical protein [Natrialbaceae archaeon AArc-T1-2]WIV66746.1 hypothetical protein QQ977_13780 [Natrialbaceae archaeon AArc-T1-2]
MKRTGRVGPLRIRRWNPIVAGAVVGLLTGLLGLFATSILANGNPLGGFAGAIGCGITVAYLSERRLSTTVLSASIADILSSVVFFCLVFVAYLTMVAVTEGLATAFFASAFFGVYYVTLGGIFAVFVGTLSIVITVIAATITSLVT